MLEVVFTLFDCRVGVAVVESALRFSELLLDVELGLFDLGRAIVDEHRVAQKKI